MGRRVVKAFPMPAPLFPLAAEPTTSLDLIPEVADPAGRGRRAWSILSRLPITEGEHAGKRIGEHAPPWQECLTKLIFGYVDDLGLRILREIFICMAKKNGKSSFAAALILTKLLLNEERREQVICLAANRLQARIVFDAMAAMIRADDELLSRFEIVDHRHLIKYAATNSRATAISAEMASTVGLNPSLAIVDELHLLGATPKGQKLVSQIRTGSVSRKEPLLISISTAPVDRSEGIFDATYRKAQRVIAGEEVDPRFFAWLCEVPLDLDPEDPANWHWSNPSLGFTITKTRLMAELESARSDPAALRDFRSQNLNISPELSAGSDRWLPLAIWDRAADTSITLEKLIAESRFVYVGIDRGGLDDLSAISVLGRTVDDRYMLWSRQWLSRQGYEKRKATNDYDAFIAAGELTIYPDGSSDLEAIVDVVRRVIQLLSIVGIDSYGAPGLAERLYEIGAEVEGVPQSWKLTPAIAWLERMLADGALRHHGSALLRWNVGNAVLERRGNAVSISKATAVGAGKIDGLASTLTAAAVLLSRAEKDIPSVYETRDLIVL